MNINTNTNTNADQEEKISGLIERVTYHNLDNGFCVLKLVVKGKKDVVTVVGHLAMVSVGEFIYGVGQWRNDKNHGLQFSAKFLKTTAPTSLEGIEKYLASGLIKGIGPVYAKKLVKAFGEEVFNIIEDSPTKLRKVEGIGAHRANQITNGWAKQKAIREIMLFLHSNGISTARAVRIYKTYGANAIEVISQNPYQLAKDVRGIGFISADKIAEKLGIEKNSMIRARAGITYALTTALDEGHCGLPKQQLIDRSIKLLEISEELIQEALMIELSNADLVEEEIEETKCILLKGLAIAEKNIAERILTLQLQLPSEELPWGKIDIPKALEWLEEKNTKNQISLSQSQKTAIESVLNTKVSVITGGPGVGKTTLVNSIIKILKAKNLQILLAAPTGRAVKRLSEVTGLEAKTLHRLLKVDMTEGGAFRNEQSPLQADVVIVDEVSMIDVPLMYSLLKAVPQEAALILVGDVDQLPSVGPGQVLRDIIESNTVNTVRLTEVFRQAAESKIITNAHRINQRLMPLIPENNSTTNPTNNLSDFYFIEVEDPEKALSTILKLISERIPKKFGFSPIKDLQVLCPMTRGVVGTRNLNIEIQKILNPPTDKAVERFASFYDVGDKVMQIENNYDKEVYNGDIGIIETIDQNEQELTIDFEGKKVNYEFNELDEVVLAYATTIHKSQGSEYKAVIIPLMMQHYNMLQKNLIYTGVTRGKNLVILIGQKKALMIALSKNRNAMRWSSLKKRLKEKFTLVQNYRNP